MLNNLDLETLAEMVKNHLESLILQRAGEEKTNQHNKSFDDEINKLYKLLAKLIIQSGSNYTISNSKGEVMSTYHSSDLRVNDDRTEFIRSLREYWSSLTFAVNSSIQYTRNGEPQSADYDRICTLLAQSIDNLRMFYVNIKENADDHGLYPFEPIKDIRNLFISLRYSQTDQSVRDEIRAQIENKWQSMREPFLSEFSRTTPRNPISPYI